MRRRPSGVRSSALALAFVAFATLAAVAALASVIAAAASPAFAATPAFDLAGRDTTCRPCDDFNRYANGSWVKANPIPPAFSSWGRFVQLREANDVALHGILDRAAAGGAHGAADQRKVGDYYASFMDTTAIERAGLTPLAPELHAIDAVSDKNALLDEI